MVSIPQEQLRVPLFAPKKGMLIMLTPFIFLVDLIVVILIMWAVKIYLALLV